MSGVPHLVQYQGSKRGIASEILKYIPYGTQRIVEPFAGTCALSILSSKEGKSDSFWLNDINNPLIMMMKECVENPDTLFQEYEKIWKAQFEDGQNNIDYFYDIRNRFNSGDKSPAIMLFLLARVVKGAVRYNAQGVMNQSCDKRRYGTKPNIVKANANGISQLLKGKAFFTSFDYKTVLKDVRVGDLVYMDPPYQGTSNREKSRDNRYIQGVDFDEFADSLADLNRRGIDFIVSYDGMTGEKKIGKDLPASLGLTHLFIKAGVSAQATLNGRNEITYESLYLSPNIKLATERYQQLELAFV